MVVIEHRGDRFPKEIEIVIGKPRPLFAVCEMRRYESVSAIEPICHRRLATHLALSAGCSALFGLARDPGYRVVHRQNAMLRTSKGELHWPAHLAGVEFVG